MNIAMVFFFITAMIVLANTTMLTRFFIWREKNIMIGCADTVERTDLSDRDSAADAFQKLESNYSVTVMIYQDNSVIYSSLHRSAAGDRPSMTGFDMLFGRYWIYEESEKVTNAKGGYFYTVSPSDSNENYIVYSRDYGDSYTVKILIRRTIIEQSADIAAEFMIFISCIGLLLALGWSVVFARRFAKPVSDMNKIAVKMSRLDFSQKLTIESDDEIGQLASSINELSYSLDTALRELNEKNARLQDEIEMERRVDTMRKGFIANVSHELKTPISIIRGYAEALDGKLACNEEKRSKYCKVIRDETERMNRLVMELLELSRIEGGMKTEYKRFDICACAQQFADIFSASAAEKQVTVNVRVPNELMVSADDMLIGHALQNYISNAVSHVNQGGTITISAEPSPVNDGKIRVSVFNTGSSVAPEDMENVWVSFWRADKSHNRAAGRFGLGLSIVKAVMVAHGNDFGVYNTDDGVCFWLELDKAKPLPQLTTGVAADADKTGDVTPDNDIDGGSLPTDDGSNDSAE